MSQGYEFSSKENRLIRKLARAMRQLSWLLGAIGLMILASATVTSWQYSLFQPFLLGSLQAGIAVLSGVWTYRAADSFQKIVDTRDRDIPNLMSALQDLVKLFRLQGGLLVLAILALSVRWIVEAIFRQRGF